MDILQQGLLELRQNIENGSKSTVINFAKVNSSWTRVTANIFQKNISPQIDGFYFFGDGTRLLIDKGLEKNFEELRLPKLSSVDKFEREEYNIFKTKEKNQSDYEIIPVFNITKYDSPKNILITAGCLIFEDMSNTGPLYILSHNDNQENLNLGYYINEYSKLKVVFLERKKPENNEPREYHIHEDDAPRFYRKKDRYFLIKK